MICVIGLKKIYFNLILSIEYAFSYLLISI